MKGEKVRKIRVTLRIELGDALLGWRSSVEEEPGDRREGFGRK